LPNLSLWRCRTGFMQPTHPMIKKNSSFHRGFSFRRERAKTAGNPAMTGFL